ncbi:MAG: acyltransferase [Armatimonadetes bacterium]|nr:acyltransferase [Akkermansiaceae bacterium]
MKSGSPSDYRPDIDGLRAVAVLSVVAYHGFPKHFDGGFIGVDIFFVISGYLITQIILKGVERNEFSILAFYGRRIRRIFPALLVVIAFCLAVGWLILFPNEFAQLGRHILSGSIFTSNFLSLSEVGYFNDAAERKPLIHLWSLAIEEQFYIFWPMLIFLLFKMNVSFIKTTTALLVISLAFCAVATAYDRDFAFYFPFSRFWELLIGAVLAHAGFAQRLQGIFPFHKHRNWASYLGLSLVILGLALINDDIRFPGIWPLLPTLGAALIILAGPEAHFNRAVLSNRAAVGVGLISYPLYLWHWPLLSFGRIAEGSFREIPLEKRLLLILMAFILSWLTFILVEKPIRYGVSQKAKAIFLSCAMAAAGGIGAVVFWTNGAPSRFEILPPAADILFMEYPHPLHNADCSDTFPELSEKWSCLLSKRRDPEVLLIGDSHAHQYYHSLAAALGDKSVLNVSAPGCFPFVTASLQRGKCERETAQILNFIDSHPSIETVYLTGYFSFLMSGKLKFGNIEGRRVADDLTETDEVSFNEMGVRVISSIVASGKRVVIIGDIPDMIFMPNSCVTTSSNLVNMVRIGTERSSQDCAIDRGEFNNRIGPFDQAMQRLVSQFPQVEFFDPRPVVCDQQKCWAMRDGRPLYWNSDHLTIEGTDLVITEMLRQKPEARK